MINENVVFTIGVTVVTLTLVLVGAKLIGALDWSWALITSPLWSPCITFFTVFFMLILTMPKK